MYAIYLQIMFQQKHISERLDDSVKRKLMGLAKDLCNDNKNIISKAPFATISIYDQKLFRSLRVKYGQDAILVFGDGSALNVKYQEPTRNKGVIHVLKKKGIIVYLINEYDTSSQCPVCERALKKLNIISIPRPYQINNNPNVMYYGLL
ncbi:hypothetical protein BD408DRAFT_372518, partial [Parasitella parasitica]